MRTVRRWRPTRVRRSERPEAGFTVVEMLVAVSIMVMVTIPMLMVLQSATSAEAAQTNRIEAGRSGAIAAERLSADVRSATSITITSAGVLQLTVTDTSGTPIAVSWSRDGADLMRTVAGGGQSTSTAVLSDLSTVAPATPFTAYDGYGNRVLASVVNCPGYISVDIERVATIGTEHLRFDVASRSLSAGSGSC